MIFFVRAATILFSLSRLLTIRKPSVTALLTVLICWGISSAQVSEDVHKSISDNVNSQKHPDNVNASVSKAVNKMPESTFLLERTLTENFPMNKHAFTVPAGMEVQIFTEYIEGNLSS